MRAALIENTNFSEGQSMVIDGPKLHHLLNVVRVKKGEEILLINGQGSSAECRVVEISKKRMEVLVEKQRPEQRPSGFAVAFATPKKDALEFCLRACVETGASKIFIVESERSQNYPLKDDRIKNIISSGIEQSNNAVLPELEICELRELPFSEFGTIALASLQVKRGKAGNGSTLLVIGPEGGFTGEEEDYILSQNGAVAVNFQGPILRTQTAIPFFAGALVGARPNIDG